MNIPRLEQVFIALRDLRRAEKKSKKLADRVGKENATGNSRKIWTKAAIERDRCFNYAREVVKNYFGLKD